MGTPRHFKKLRLAMTVHAVLAPLICFGAFVWFASGWMHLIDAYTFLWFLIPYMLIGLLLPRFEKSVRGDIYVKWAKRIAWFLLIIWFLSNHEVYETILQVWSVREIFWNWPIIGAGALWTGCGIYSAIRRISQIPDREIYEYYQ